MRLPIPAHPRPLVLALFPFAALGAVPATALSSSGNDYLATSTDSVNRLETPLIELPLHADVITEEFIRDTGALDLSGALAYTAGLETTFTSLQPGTGPVGLSSYRMRGFVQNTVIRDGFRTEGYTDIFNITQVEVLRGPNGLLYGAGTAGGTVVYHTRQPTDVPVYSLAFAAGSYDFRRMTASASGPVNETLRYSLSALFSDSEGWYDYVDQERLGFAPVVEWMPFEKTTVLVEGELLRLEGNDPSNDPFQFQLDPFQVDLTQPGAPLVRVPYVRTGVYPDPNVGFFDYPGGRRWEGANDRKDEDASIRIGLNQQIGDDLEIDFGYFGSKRERKKQTATVDIQNVDDLLSSGDFFRLIQAYPWLVNPIDPTYGSTVDEFGNLLSYGWQREEFEETRHQLRLETKYHLPVSDMWTNDFLLGASYIETDIEAGGWELVTLDPDSITVQPLSGSFETAVPRLRALSDFSPIQFDPRPGEFYAGGTGDPTTFTERGVYFVHTGNYWDDRIRSVTGLRYNKFSVKRPPRRNSVTGEIDDPNYPGREDTPSTTNLSFGLSMSPHKNSPWSVYLLSASAVEPVFGRYDATGRALPPGESRSYEAGMKFALFDGRLNGTLSVYEIEREDVPVSSNEIRLAGFGEPGFNPSARPTALRDDRSRGVDLSAVITDLPLRNLQTVLGFSYVDYEMTGFGGPSYDPATQTFERRDVFYDPGRTGNGTPEYSFRAWTQYTFRDGPLDGLDLGLGFRWTDERESVLGLYTDNAAAAASFFVEDPVTTWDTALGYTRTFGDVRCRVQLNVFNLADEEGTYAYAYREPQGRETRVTVSLQF